jgi:hypothetical protein
MKALWMTAVLAGTATAADITAAVVAEGPSCPYAAKRIASGIFGRAGVTLEWVKQKRGATPACVQVRLLGSTPDDYYPDAMAFAYPYGGCNQRITVFLDRIRARAADPAREATLLAYVLVHEITHVIQGVRRHSDSGIMKARWTAAEYDAIFGKRMVFEDRDIRLMERALAVGLLRRPPTLIGQSGTETGSRPE